MIEEPVMQVGSDVGGQIRGVGELRHGVFSPQIVAELVQLAAVDVKASPFEIDQTGEMVLSSRSILGFGYSGAVTRANDSDIELTIGDLRKRGGTDVLGLAAKIFHTHELGFAEALQHLFHGFALILQIDPGRADENTDDTPFGIVFIVEGPGECVVQCEQS